MSGFATFDELLDEKTDAPVYGEVEAYGTKIRLVKLSAFHLLKWGSGPKDEAGLRLAAMSIVDENGQHMSEEQQGRFIEACRKKEKNENTKLAAAAMTLNDFEAMLKAAHESKNASGEAPTDASRTDLPSRSVNET